jgi:DNA-binding SARP family transcriptional activator
MIHVEGPAGADRLELYLFGRFRVDCGGRELPRLTCAKSRELLAYLLLHRGRSHRREAVAEVLWGDGGCGEPRKALRQALWHLRSAIDYEPPLIEALGGDWIRIHPGASFWLDVAAFESEWLELENLIEPSEESFPAQRALKALGLYQGDLLEGSSWDWCRFERTRLRDMFLTLADRAMTWCLGADDFAAGMRLGFDLLRHDPARESAHRHLMRFHVLTGDRSGALRQYEQCVAALRDELGVEPSQSTRHLFEHLRDCRVATAAAAGRAAIEPPPQPATGLLDGLRQYRMLLSQARREVHLEILALERGADTVGLDVNAGRRTDRP